MNARPVKLLFITLLLISISAPACNNKPTYSRERLKESVVKLCKDEYGLDVDVKIIGSTLGVFIPVEGLVDQDLKLDEKAGKKIEDAALSIHRVTMSTDRPLEIYTLTARDTNTLGAEFVLTGFIYDVVRVRLLDISRGEYHKRILRDFRFNPSVVGEAKIKELFQGLNEGSPLTQNIKPLFYPIYAIGKAGSQKIEIKELLFKEISAQESLFYIKTREYYDPLPGLEPYKTIFPSGFNNEYLILVDISMFQNPIKEIVPMYFYSDKKIRQRDLKKTFKGYKDIGYIGLDGLPKRELSLDWFLSQTIPRRISMLFTEDKDLKENFRIENSRGTIENKVFRFRFSVTPVDSSYKDNGEILARILKLVGTVIHRYSFEGFEGVIFTDEGPDGKEIYLSREDLERFRRKKIKIKDLI